MEENAFGLPRELIDKLEAKMSSITFESVVERLDSVFGKSWGYHLHGPDVVQVPKRVPRNPQAKAPRAFKYEEVPHWQCGCSIEIFLSLDRYIDRMADIVREYSVLIPMGEDGTFEMARDLAFIYTAHYGLGVGKKSKEIFDHEDKVEVVIGAEKDDLEVILQELSTLKKTLGVKRNSELDSYVIEFNREMDSYMDINKTNVKDFVAFLKEKIQAP